MSCCPTYHSRLGGDIQHYSSSGHVVKEKGKEFRLASNSISFCKIKIDGGLYPKGQASKKCDWVFVMCDSNQLIFVELKGNGESIQGTPFNQITETIQEFQQQIPSLRKSQIFGVIVGGRTPGKQSPLWRKKQDEFRKNFGAKLDRKDPTYEFNI